MMFGNARINQFIEVLKEDGHSDGWFNGRLVMVDWNEHDGEYQMAVDDDAEYLYTSSLLEIAQTIVGFY
mgnify:CR=1 FL=1